MNLLDDLRRQFRVRKEALELLDRAAPGTNRTTKVLQRGALKPIMLPGHRIDDVIIQAVIIFFVNKASVILITVHGQIQGV